MGVLVLVLAAERIEGASLGWSVGAGIFASLCYGVGLHLVRCHLAGLPPAAVACSSLGSNAVLLSPFDTWTWPNISIPPVAWSATLGLDVLCTGLAYVIYYRLAPRMGPSRTSAVTYLIPAFLVTWARWLLGEPLTAAIGCAAVMILGSLPWRSGSHAESAGGVLIVDGGLAAR